MLIDLGGYTALATKGIASMLSDTLWKAITFPITYLLLAILIATALMQIRYLNRALSRFDSTQVIPTQFVIFTISVIVGSAILYRDFESADAQRFCKFIGGCALTFLGVYLITSGRESNDGTRKEDENDKEQGIDLINEEEISENEIAEDGRFTTPSRSTRTSQRPPSRTSLVERMISNVSQQSQPYTPSSLGPDSPFGQNLWTESPRDDNFRRHSNYASSSVVIDTSTNNTPVRPSFLTPTSGRHSRQRGSMVDIFPGLISTTLSSSLSGIMVDRRRDFEASSSKARRGLGPGRSKSSRLRNTESGGSWNGLQRTLPSAPVLTFEALTTNDPVEVVGTDDSSKRFLFRSLSIGDPSGSSSTAGQRLESKADANTGADTSGDQRCFTSTS